MSLYNRAWICHLVISINRVVYAILGLAQWQKIYKTLDESDENDEIQDNFDLKFVHTTKKTVQTLMIVGIVMGVLLDILVWGKRNCASWILYFECIYMIMTSFAPVD